MTKILDVRTELQIDVLCDTLRAADFIYFDLETMAQPDGEAHEDWRPSSRITTASFTTVAGQSWTVPLSHPEAAWSATWREVATLLFEACRGTKLGAHNAKFDVRWVHSATGVDLVDDLSWDTMVSAYVLDENELKGLKDLAPAELGVPPWDEEIDNRRTEEFPWGVVREYAARDTDYGFQLVERHRERLRDEPALARIFGLLMMPVCRALIRVERNGLLLDRRVTEERLAASADRIVEIEDELLERYVPDDLKDIYCWKRYKRKDPVSVRPTWSPNSKFFHEFMAASGAPVLERTAKKGTPSWSESVMKRLAAMDSYPWVADLLEARKLGKDTGYLRSWLALADEHDRLHPSFKPAHVATGRLSSSNPNAQQVSRHLKACFVAEPGWRFVQADYAQVELRIAAELAHEKQMLEAFAEGKDLHRIMAAQIAGCETHEVTKEQRQNAKAVNFGFLYGMGARKFVDYAFDEYGVVFTLQEASRIRRLFFATWPRLGDWHEEQRRTAHTHGYVRSPLGRRRRLPDLTSPLQGKVSAAERQGINAPVQSYASDLMLLSIIDLDRHPSPDRRVVGTVHDSLLAEVRAGCVKREVGRIAQAMLYPATKRLFGAELSVPLEVEFVIGNGWGDPDARVVTVQSNPNPRVEVDSLTFAV